MRGKILEELGAKAMEELKGQAIASFCNHYPVYAEYRSELDGPDFQFDYDRFLQPLRSKENHFNSKVVQEFVEQSLQAMIAHAHDVLRENKRKGDEVVKRILIGYKTRIVLIDRKYEKQHNADAIARGVAAGPQVARFVLETPNVSWFVLAAGAVAGGWMAAKLSRTYIRTSRYELQKRYMKMQANGETCFDNWTKVTEFTDTEEVNEKQNWTKGEVSHESELRLEALGARQWQRVWACSPIEAELGCKQNKLAVISLSWDSDLVVKDGNVVEVGKKKVSTKIREAVLPSTFTFDPWFS